MIVRHAIVHSQPLDDKANHDLAIIRYSMLARNTELESVQPLLKSNSKFKKIYGDLVVMPTVHNWQLPFLHALSYKAE